MISDQQCYKLIITSCSGSTLRPISFSGHEQVMEPFWFSVDVVQPATQPVIDLAKAIGSQATFSILVPNAARAEVWTSISGIIGQISHTGTGDDWHHYQVLLVPKLKLLSQVRNSRVFRDQKLQDIVDKVLAEAGVPAAKWSLSGAAAKLGPRAYVVQHDETDLDFICRLCARFGVWYFFSFGADTTDLVFTDVNTTFGALKGDIPFQPEARTQARGPVDWHRQEVVRDFSETRTLVPFKAKVRGWKSDQPQDPPEGEHQNKDIANSEFAEYLFGAQVPERTGPGTQDVFAGQPDCTQLARQAVEDHAVRHRLCTGSGDVRGLRAGMVMGLKGRVIKAPDQWVVLSVSHEGAQGAGRGAGEEGRLFYRNQFSAIPKDDKLPYRPAERPWPKIPGFLTAQVESTGGSGDPYANLDDQGRYHVRLASDRENQGDAKASLPVRMLSPYSGKEWGFHLPLHHGAEVLLAHVDGDPDRPVIAGAVPNTTTPQIVNHDNQTQSRWLTAGKNELTFEDKKNSEQVYLHAQKDRKTEIENDETKTVGHDQSLDVGNDQKIHVAKNRADNVDENVETNVGGNVTLMVKKNVSETIEGGQTEEIKKDKSESITGASTLAIGKNLTVTVDGDHSDSSKKGRTIKAKKINILADDEITIKTGSAIIQMKKNGDITIEGKKITIKGSGDLVMKGSKIGEN